MPRVGDPTPVQNPRALVPDDEERPLRTVVLEHADHCFLDTDGITRDASRMLAIMDRWRPHRTDENAGVRRNSAFNPSLQVVVTHDLRICYPHGLEPLGERALLFTIVARDDV